MGQINEKSITQTFLSGVILSYLYTEQGASVIIF